MGHQLEDISYGGVGLYVCGMEGDRYAVERGQILMVPAQCMYVCHSEWHTKKINKMNTTESLHVNTIHSECSCMTPEQSAQL